MEHGSCLPGVSERPIKCVVMTDLTLSDSNLWMVGVGLSVRYEPPGCRLSHARDGGDKLS